MITKRLPFHFAVAENVAVENDVVGLLALPEETEQVVACTSISLESGDLTHWEAQVLCLNYFKEKANAKLRAQALWFFAKSCDRDSAVFRHLGLWKPMKRHGFVPGSTRTEVVSRSSGGSICFFGGAHLRWSDFGNLGGLLSPYARAFVAGLPSGLVPSVQELLDATCWEFGPSDRKELGALVAFFVEKNGFFVRLFGSFDDPETGVDIFMGQELYGEVAPMLEVGASR